MPYGYGSANRGSSGPGPGGQGARGQATQGGGGGGGPPSQGGGGGQAAAQRAAQQASAQRAMQQQIAQAEAQQAAKEKIAAAATPGYQNIFQTGAVSQTPGYQPPTPAGTGEGLGSIAGPIQGLIDQPKIAGPIQGLIDQPKPPLRTRIQDDRAEDIRKKALGNIALQTDKSLTDVYDPSGQGQGIMSGFADMGTKEGLMSAGKNYAKKAAINYGLQKAGLGFINPFLGLANMFFPNLGKSIASKFPKGTGTKTAWQPDESSFRGQGQGQAQDNVIQASIQEFSPEQADMMKQRHSQLQGVIDSGVYQGRQLTAEEIQMLQQKSLDIQKLMEQYLVNPDELGLARGGIAGLHG